MKHLSSVEFAEFIGGALPPGREAHLAACDRCRLRAEELRTALAAARDVEVPEPSPLYWDHLSSRIRAAVAAEPLSSDGSWLWRPAYGLALAVAVAGLLVVASGLRMWRPAGEPAGNLGVPEERVGLEALAGFEVGPTDETWEMVIVMSSDLEWNEAEEAGFAVRQRTADRLLSTLTVGEQTELVRILRAELPGGTS